MSVVIGIVPDIDGDYSRGKNTYVRAIEEAGATALIIPYSTSKDVWEEYSRICDGFIFAGGVDIAPRHYGEERSPALEEVNERRDEFEFNLFEVLIKSEKPIFGICRGMQFLNVAFGGTLYQDIPTELKTDIIHRAKKGEDFARHSVKVVADTPLYDILSGKVFEVNSVHHQGVKELGNGLVGAAYSSDGLVEAFYHESHPCLFAVQWHPELTVFECENSKALFKSLKDAALKAKE